MPFRIANAPVSWGILEVEGWSPPLPYTTFLDELRSAGYEATELGPYGYLPTNPDTLCGELESRRLTLTSAFVPIRLKEPNASLEDIQLVGKVLQTQGAKFLVLADALWPERVAVAGRVEENDVRLSSQQWTYFAENITRAMELADSLSLQCVFHHHVGSYIETPEEITRLLEITRVGLCLDTGHHVYGGGDAVEAVKVLGSRIQYLHLKDVDSKRLARAREGHLDYLSALRSGAFCPLGSGCVPFPELLRALDAIGYDSWAVVEQDIDAVGGSRKTPLENARASRQYLRSILESKRDNNAQSTTGGSAMTLKLTTAQAIVKFLKQQYVERDGPAQPFFGGCLGIFGHGNVAGVGEALQENLDFPYYLCRNEQGMVHIAAAFAKMSNRLRTLVCTTSIGPGATNMITGAAAATINRVPVLLLPGDIFARRNVAPVLQQLESPTSQDVSVNDCFKPVCRYWDRIQRAEQIITALPEAMRVLTSPAETGAVTLALPQDVQSELFEFPARLFDRRVWTIQRPRGDAEAFRRALRWIRDAKKPIMVVGGGVIYGEATQALSEFAAQTGIPVGETQAGKGSLCFNHGQAVGAIGVTGTPGANVLAREADLVIGIGTRYSDFTTASKTAFQNPDVRFININVAEFDAFKHNALPLVADAKVALEELSRALVGYHVDSDYQQRIQGFRVGWEQEVDRIHNLRHGPPISQGEVIGVVNGAMQPRDVVVCAAGSLPGDLHKLWRTTDPKGYHLEYGYSTMGYEIAGGLGIKMADPSREVYVMVGDGSYLMMAQEIVTSLQEGYKLNIIVIDNHGFSSIGGLSKACGSGGFGTEYRYRVNGSLSGESVAVDFAANAASLGAEVVRVRSRDELSTAVAGMSKHDRTNVVVIETDMNARVGGYESWWDVPIAEVSTVPEVNAARRQYEDRRKKERYFL